MDLPLMVFLMQSSDGFLDAVTWVKFLPVVTSEHAHINSQLKFWGS